MGEFYTYSKYKFLKPNLLNGIHFYTEINTRSIKEFSGEVSPDVYTFWQTLSGSKVYYNSVKLSNFCDVYLLWSLISTRYSLCGTENVSHWVSLGSSLFFRLLGFL